MPPTSAIGTYSIAPAAVFAAVALTGALRCFGITIPVTPAVSARADDRAEIARVGHAVERDEERASDRRAASSRSAERSGSARRDDALRRIGLRRRAQAARATPSAASNPRPSTIASISSSRSTLLRHPHAAHRPRTRAQQLQHRAPPFDLVRPRPRRAAAGAGCVTDPLTRRSLTGARSCRRRRPRG